jgi:hypothetical protein
MSLKPTDITQWALNSANETRQGGANKVIPSLELRNNGSLDGQLSLNHFNWIINNLGLWSEFLSDMVVTKNGNGLTLVKDDHSAFIVAFNKVTLANHIVGIANKNGSSAPTVHTLQNSTLTFGTPTITGDIPIVGALASNVVVLSLNFKV